VQIATANAACPFALTNLLASGPYRCQAAASRGPHHPAKGDTETLPMLNRRSFRAGLTALTTVALLGLIAVTAVDVCGHRGRAARRSPDFFLLPPTVIRRERPST
jgi:hypothetical protein